MAKFRDTRPSLTGRLLKIRELKLLYMLTFILVLIILSVYYFRLSRQIEEHSHKQVGMAFELILDDLKKRSDELKPTLRQFARTSLAGPLYMTQLIQQQIKQQQQTVTVQEVRKLMQYLNSAAHEIRKLGQELAASEILVYDAERKLTAFYRTIPQKEISGVYLPAISEQTFIPVEAKENWLRNLQDLSELPQQTLPEKIPRFYQREIPEAVDINITALDGKLALEVIAPVMGRRNVEGLCMCYIELSQQDVERYSRLSQTQVNIFSGSHLSVGMLSEYNSISEKSVKQLQAFDLYNSTATPQISNSKVTIAGKHYYQGLLNLGKRPNSLGTIAVLFPRYLEERRQGEFGILIVSIILLFGVLYKDIRRAEKIEELNQELKIRAAELEQTNTQLTAEVRERKKIEKELHSAKDIAEAANRAKSRFLANMSHELRTPLNAILGYAQILKEDLTLNELQQRGITTIQQSGEHLLTLISEILDLAKIESGRMELQEHPSLLADLLDSLTEMIRVRARQKHLHFNYEYDTSLPRSVLVDPKRLREVLLNLLGNAVKLTENGTVTFRVSRVKKREHVPEVVGAVERHQAEENGQDVTILFEVEDTGPGIPAEQLQEIFAPFHQLPEHRSSSQGTGLGLTISQKFVKMMGGNISVRSTLGQGSAFSFVLTLRETVQTRQNDKLSQKKIIGYTGARRHLLVVDDTAENRAILKDILGSLDFQIMEAEDGQDGLRIAAETSPDLILSDLVMPEMDGFELARRIRQSEIIHHTPLLAVSANAFDDVKTRCLEAGFDDFITKPFRMKHVLGLLERYLNLEWIYESQSFGLKEKPATGANLSQTLKLLPDERRLALLKQVNRGDVKGILKELELIEQLGSQFHPFTKELRTLARRFQINQLIERLAENN